MSGSAWNSSNPLLNNSTCKPYHAIDSTTTRATLIAAYSVVLLLSLVGNAMIVALYCKNSSGRLRTPVHFFIVNMAVSDIFIPIFLIPRRIQEIHLGWGPWQVSGVPGEILCKIVNYIDEVSTAVSIQSVIFIAVERCWSIIFPMKPSLISRRATPRCIAFTWIFAMIFFLYYFFAYKLTQSNGDLFCEYSLPNVFNYWQELWIVDRMCFLVVFVAIPFLLLTVLYTIIVISLCTQQNRIVHLAGVAQRQILSENRRIALMVIIVVALFFIGWTPYYVYFFEYYFISNGNSSWSCRSLTVLHWSSYFLNYINAGTNPLVYYTFNATYRKGFNELLRCCCLRNPVSHQNGQSQVAGEPENGLTLVVIAGVEPRQNSTKCS